MSETLQQPSIESDIDAVLEEVQSYKAFKEIPTSRQGRVLLQLPPSIQQIILQRASAKRLADIVGLLDADEATDVLQLLERQKRNRVLTQLPSEFQNAVQFLLRFHPESAAGLMNLDYITVEQDISFRDVSERIEAYEEKTGKFPTVLVVDNGRYIGELPGHSLAVQEKTSESIAAYVAERPSVSYNQDEEAVIDTFRQHPNGKVVVLDEHNAILGVIYSDDLLRVIEKQAGETLYDFAGVSDEESVLDSPLLKVQNRYKWLIVNLGTAFLAASVVGLFEQTIAAFTLLAVYMPIVAGMGGNAGTQTMAVVVRGIALDQVSLNTGWRVIGNEIVASAINGVINGVIVAAIAVLWNKNPMLGAVIGVSMVLNLILAGFFGAIIPLALKQIDQDPATSATIFITTATDVLGFFIFLGLATVLL